MSTNEKRRRAKGPIAVAAGLMSGLLLSAFTVWNASQAAFSDTESNETNAWNAGSVTLTDTAPSAVPMFRTSTVGGHAANTNNLTETGTQENCIVLRYDGTLSPQEVKLYVTNFAGTLDPYLNVTIETGAGGAFGNCTGFVAGGAAIYSGTLNAFRTARTGWADGLATGWTPAIAGETKVFKFTTSVSGNAAQAKTASADFTWETRQ
ncbi:hypothetical protein QLQ12_46550 [Actinoplanes sp. NEAU-A12]|uniref:SipW-cognate class signal peptide n=1 Tax=Actinoplanes sandaracinus TaxID=3045177 RepID=A0ABT6X1Z8_9ACTN|nr:hypothetical protein [Actinoplanes sandaracinus]MDI6106047.1 hypothetical protein [Actinoplanes sandaracinus]